MTEVVLYEAPDGKRFTSKADCIAYEEAYSGPVVYLVLPHTMDKDIVRRLNLHASYESAKNYVGNEEQYYTIVPIMTQNHKENE